MKYLLLIVVIALIYIVGFYLPNSINKRYAEIYGCEIWSRPLAVIEGICLSGFLLMLDRDDIWFWISLILMIVSYISGIGFTIKCYKECNATTNYLLLGLAGQILSSLALAFIILIIFTAIVNSDTKKKKRRRK